MQSQLNRVQGWIKYKQFEPLQIASVGEIIFYIKDMFKEASARRSQYGWPARDIGMVGGYDVRAITPYPPYRDPFITESAINYRYIQEGYISSTKSYLTIFQYQDGSAMGLYLPPFDKDLIE